MYCGRVGIYPDLYDCQEIGIACSSDMNETECKVSFCNALPMFEGLDLWRN